MNNISQLIDKRNALLATATGLVQRGLNTPTTREDYKRILAESDEVQDTIDMLQKIGRVLPNLPIVSAPAPAVRSSGEQLIERKAKLNAAWRSWLKGDIDSRVEEHRELLESSSDGQALIPQEFSGFIATTLKWYAPLTQYARTKNSTRPVKTAFVDDTAAGLTLVVDGVAPTEADPATLSSNTTSLDSLSAGTIRYSIQLLENASTFDLEQFLTTLASARVGRGTEKALVTGKDSAGNALPNNPGLICLAQTALTTSSLSAGVTFANLVRLSDSLDPAYWVKANWYMTSKTRNNLITQLDSTNRSLFVPAPGVDGLDMLLGRPIVITQSLDQISVASGTPVILADLYNGLEVISSDVRVTNIRERWLDQLLQGIIPWIRLGSAGLARGAIQALRLAAA